MARFSRVEVWNRIERDGLVPLFYNGDVETSKAIVRALADGGAGLVEFTNRGSRAMAVFGELVDFIERECADVILGVGSVLDAVTAGMYINLGANFVVGSVTNRDVALLCNRRKIVYSPGCATPSEISYAEELGVEIVKVFPGKQVGGPGFVKAILGPCPWAKVMVTGGVDASEENIKGWFDAGATAVGMGSKLVRKDLVAEGRWDDISALTAQCLAWVRKARGVPLYLGIEHVGVCANADVSAESVAHWYGEQFGGSVDDLGVSYMVRGEQSRWVEVMKKDFGYPCHIGILVSDFAAAVADLKARDVALKEPVDFGTSRLIYLEEPDPLGNWVHLVWMAK